MPGSQRSSEPWSTSSRFRRSGASVEPVGDPRREPERPPRRAARRRRRSRRRRPSRSRAGASAGRADRVDRGARVLDAHVEPAPRLDPVAHLGEARAPGSAARAGATSHSRDALHVPSTSPPWPPLTQTTAAAASQGPVMRISAPVRSRIAGDCIACATGLRRRCRRSEREVDHERRADAVALRHEIVPPCASTIAFAIERPRPAPGTASSGHVRSGRSARRAAPARSRRCRCPVSATSIRRAAAVRRRRARRRGRRPA